MEQAEGNVIGLRQAADDVDGAGQSQAACNFSGVSSGGGKTKRVKKRNFARKRQDDGSTAELLYDEEAMTDTGVEAGMGAGVHESGSNGKIEIMMKQILDRLKALEKSQQVNYENLTKRLIDAKAANRDRDRDRERRSTQRTSRVSKAQGKAEDEEGEKTPEGNADESKKLTEQEVVGTSAPTIAEDGFWKVADYWFERTLNNRQFDRVVGVIILCNCIEIGWSIENELRGNSKTPSKVLDSLFLVIFIIELMIRFAGSKKSWKETANNNWVKCDIFLISIGCICSWIVEPILESCSGDCTTSQAVGRWFQVATVLRLFRMFRFLRALRFFRTFKTLWKLANGLVQSMGTIVWTLALIVFILYVFACLCIELITKDPELSATLEETIEKHYSSLLLTMFSLVGFVTLDNASDLYWDIVMEKQELALLFIPLLLVVSIALVNLVTAVLVENAIESARADKEYQKELNKQKINAVRPEIVEAFHIIDASGDGEADLQEVLDAFEELPDVITEQVSKDAVKEVFELLDFDGTGTISEEEFVEGILQLTLSEQPIETKQMLKALSFIREDLTEVKAQIEKVMTAKQGGGGGKMALAVGGLLDKVKANGN